MAISLIFSGLLYRVSSEGLEHNVNRQVGYFNNFLTQDDVLNYSTMRQHQLDEDLSRLKTNLFTFNLLVLAAGGAASYWLARRTLEPIEAAMLAQSRFAGDASHELRTPLTAIQTENEVALRNSNLTKAEAIVLLKSNLEEVAKLKSLSDGLLRLANDSGRIEHPQPVDISEVLNIAISRLSKAATQKQIKIMLKPAKLKVLGDKDSLVELMAIFIDNSIRYSPGKTSVDLSARRHGKEIIVKVADQGQGIDSAELAKIFERFYRGDSSRSKDQGEGYGLGLAIAKQIAQAHNGHIDVSSTPGKGSTFSVHLPSA